MDSVSLRRVTSEAGARNVVAVQYHFGDRAGLLRAILDRHQPDVEQRRHALLDAYEAAGRDDMRALAGALVRPLAAKLDDPDGGPEFLRISAELLNRADPVIDPASLEDPTNSMYRWREHVAALMDHEAVRLHRRFAAVVFTTSELARRAAAVGTARDHRLFASLVVDTVTGMLKAPISAETRRLSEDRRRTRAGGDATDDP